MKSRTLFSKCLPYQLETQRQTLRLRHGCFVLFDSTKRPLFYKQRRLLSEKRLLIFSTALTCMYAFALPFVVYALSRPLVMADPAADSPVKPQARRFSFARLRAPS